MKTKEEIIAVIEKIKSLNIALSVADYEAVLHYLKLSTLNPMKIDEERMKKIHHKFYDITYSKSQTKRIVQEYNSAIEDHQVLQPLPSEMPELFGGSIDKRFYITDTVTMDDLYQEIRNHYGTPTKKELVSVEELGKEIADIHVPFGDERKLSRLIAQHIIDTYSLNPAKREWWMDLKEGEKFKDGKGGVFIFDGMFYIGSDGVYSHPANKSTPYIEPSIHDKFMASLSDEQKKMYEEIKESTK